MAEQLYLITSNFTGVPNKVSIGCYKIMTNVSLSNNRV